MFRGAQLASRLHLASTSLDGVRPFWDLYQKFPAADSIPDPIIDGSHLRCRTHARHARARLIRLDVGHRVCQDAAGCWPLRLLRPAQASGDRQGHDRGCAWHRHTRACKRNCVRVSLPAPAHYAPTLRQHIVRTVASARALTRTDVDSLSQAPSAIGARSS